MRAWLGIAAVAVSVAALLVAAAPARADVDKPAAKSTAPRVKPGVLAVVTAVVPGFVTSGAGTWVAGDKRTAKRLFHVQLLGLGIASAGALPMFLTGASRRTTAMTMPLVLTGSGIFFGSWMADIVAAATGGTSLRPGPAPRLELELGYAYAYEPQFDYANFAVAGLDLRRGDTRGSAETWIALDDDAQRVRGEVAWRRWQRADGSFLEGELAATFDRLGDFDVEVYTVEASVLGRYDMARLGSPLRGAFMEIGLGVGIEHYRFANGALWVDLPLARAGYGLYLGRGEAQVYYDHRHDEITGGLGTGLQFDGPYGHFGLEGHYWITDRVGVEAQMEVGSAALGRAAVKWAL